jgi:hypothetical protein
MAKNGQEMTDMVKIPYLSHLLTILAILGLIFEPVGMRRYTPTIYCLKQAQECPNWIRNK